ncbi:MAG TPA: hypothetical protein VJ867_01275 [Gemmatimonadaceae bacterium]|nr:hypothetical protein [Gemmatimonadaceae bacterium]
MTMFARSIAAASMLLAVAAPAIAAQKSSFSDAESKELYAYRLSMEGLNKYEAAMKAFAAAAQKDPRYAKQIALKKQIDELKAKEDPSDADQTRMEELEQQLSEAEAATDDNSFSRANTIADMAAAITANPMFSSALRSAGLTPREYSVMTLVLFQSAMWAGMKKQGFAKDLPKDVNPANVAFMEQHEAEFAAMQQRFKEMSGEKDRDQR